MPTPAAGCTPRVLVVPPGGGSVGRGSGSGPVGDICVRIFGPRPGVCATHALSCAELDGFSCAQLIATTKTGNPVGVVYLSQHALIPHREVLNIMGNPYTVRVQHQTLYRLAPPLRAAGFQIAGLGLAREASVSLLTAERDNLKHARLYQVCPSLLSLCCV